MFIANLICRFNNKKGREVVENGRNVTKRCWYAGYSLSSCRAMLQEAQQKLAQILELGRPDDDFKIACWEHTIKVLGEEVSYRMKNDID